MLSPLHSSDCHSHVIIICKMETELEMCVTKQTKHKKTACLYSEFIQVNSPKQQAGKWIFWTIFKRTACFYCESLRRLYRPFKLPASLIVVFCLLSSVEQYRVFCHDNNVQIAPFITVFDGEIGWNQHSKIRDKHRVWALFVKTPTESSEHLKELNAKTDFNTLITM